MKFKVGDKVKNIINGNVGKVKSIEKKLLSEEFKEEVDKRLGVFNRIYYVGYPEGFASWHTIVEIEKVEEILDEKEKEYLSNVIKPFKKRIEGIYKCVGLNGYEYIEINVERLNTSDIESISLPDFKKGTMYKNMKICKRYTLKDLNLD